MQAKLNKLLLVVEGELKKAERNYLDAKKSASEVAASASLSPSQAGDRYHAQGTADLAEQRLKSLRKLKEEIALGAVRLIKENGNEFFLVKNITLIPGVKLVSVDSPIGKKLMNNVG